MKQKPNEPNADKNIRYLFRLELPRGGRTSDKNGNPELLGCFSCKNRGFIVKFSGGKNLIMV